MERAAGPLQNTTSIEKSSAEKNSGLRRPARQPHPPPSRLLGGLRAGQTIRRPNPRCAKVKKIAHADRASSPAPRYRSTGPSRLLSKRRWASFGTRRSSNGSSSAGAALLDQDQGFRPARWISAGQSGDTEGKIVFFALDIRGLFYSAPRTEWSTGSPRELGYRAPAHQRYQGRAWPPGADTVAAAKVRSWPGRRLDRVLLHGAALISRDESRSAPRGGAGRSRPSVETPPFVLTRNGRLCRRA